VGALLVAVILVVPAATARLLTARVRPLQVLSTLLAAGEGIVALWWADRLNVGPGPAMAVLGGAVFAAVAAWTARTRGAR
jgi:ABC-type Mn2+/Zn2+ transport system permease subunit